MPKKDASNYGMMWFAGSPFVDGVSAGIAYYKGKYNAAPAFVNVSIDNEESIESLGVQAVRVAKIPKGYVIICENISQLG